MSYSKVDARILLANHESKVRIFNEVVVLAKSIGPHAKNDSSYFVLGMNFARCTDPTVRTNGRAEPILLRPVDRNVRPQTRLHRASYKR